VHHSDIAHRNDGSAFLNVTGSRVVNGNWSGVILKLEVPDCHSLKTHIDEQSAVWKQVNPDWDKKQAAPVNNPVANLLGLMANRRGVNLFGNNILQRMVAGTFG